MMNIVRQHLTRPSVPVTRIVARSLASQAPKSTPNASTEGTAGSQPRKLSPEAARAEAAKLAMQSLKDMGSMLSSSSDDAVQPIDTRPVYKNPAIFGTLSLLHQGQVLTELQEKYDKKWSKLTEEDKKLGYFIAYGNWGVREKFSNWNTEEPPYDLPFEIPSKVKELNPKPKDLVSKLPTVYLSETPVRKEQFDIKKMDGVTKFFIFITLLVLMVAFARDKKIGEAGKPLEIIVEDQYTKLKEEKERLARIEQARIEKEEEARRNSWRNRKWYYLWLK